MAARLKLSFTTPAGATLEPDPPAARDDSVAALRRRLATQLGRHHRQVRLYHEAAELSDAQLLQDAFPGLEALVTVLVTQPRPEELAEFIQVGPPLITDALCRGGRGDCVAYAPLCLIDTDWFDSDSSSEHVEFPAPSGISINMLPFVMGDRGSLPEEYQQYWAMIEACRLPERELGKVGYLTIQEGTVAEGQPQRRGGVHIETPGLIMGADGRYHAHPRMWGCGFVESTRPADPRLPRVEGGIYMANTVAGSCQIWNTLITDPGLVVGHHGDLEHVRHLLGSPCAMRENQLYWLTDRTPHESLPLKKARHRQYFRLVTSRLSAWFPQHSTSNPLGVLPDPAVTKVLDIDKFETLPAALPPPQERLWRVTRVCGIKPRLAGREGRTLLHGTIVRGTRDGALVKLSDGSGEVLWSQLAACDGVQLTICLENALELEAWESKWACAAADAGLDLNEYACDMDGLVSFVNVDMSSPYSWDWRAAEAKLNVDSIRYPARVAAVFSKESRWAGSAATYPSRWEQKPEQQKLLPTHDFE